MGTLVLFIFGTIVSGIGFVRGEYEMWIAGIAMMVISVVIELSVIQEIKKIKGAQ